MSHGEFEVCFTEPIKNTHGISDAHGIYEWWVWHVMGTWSTTTSEQVFGGRRIRKRNADWGTEPGSAYGPYIYQSPFGNRIQCTTHLQTEPSMCSGHLWGTGKCLQHPWGLHQDYTNHACDVPLQQPELSHHHPSGMQGCHSENASPSAQPKSQETLHRIINHLMMFKDSKLQNNSTSLPFSLWGGAEEKIYICQVIIIWNGFNLDFWKGH